MLTGDTWSTWRLVPDSSQAHLGFGPAVTPESEKTSVSFTPERLMTGRPTTSVSTDALLTALKQATRYFHATFADHVDIAILSDTSSRTTAIKTWPSSACRTQYEINDWATYFDAGWFTHYDRSSCLAGCPGQGQAVRRRRILREPGEPARRTVLESHVRRRYRAGAPWSTRQPIYGLDQGLAGRLPFGLDIQAETRPARR